MTEAVLREPCFALLRRPRLQRLVLVLLCLCLVTAAVLFHFRMHLFWKYTERQKELPHIEALPIAAMPVVAVPEGWVTWKQGCMEISLPAALANGTMQRSRSKSSFVLRDGGNWSITGALPFDGSNGFSAFLTAASHVSPTNREFTLPELWAECLSVSSDDFSWRMTPDEVNWHSFSLTLGQPGRTSNAQRAETLFDDNDLKGFVTYNDLSASFVWQYKGHTHGYMTFISREPGHDLTWVRAACQSLKITCETKPDEVE